MTLSETIHRVLRPAQKPGGPTGPIPPSRFTIVIEESYLNISEVIAKVPLLDLALIQHLISHDPTIPKSSRRKL